MADEKLTRWLVKSEERARATVRLICVPFVGGAASAYRPWSRDLPEQIEVAAIQLPARESRFSEAPCHHLHELVSSLRDVILSLNDLPFALFGHSMGALISFELARELRRRGGPAPVHLFASAFPAPHLPRRRRSMHDLPRDELLEEVRQLGGTPEAVLKNAEMVSFLLPMLRADFEICDTYQFVDEPPLDCPITAFAAKNDSLAPVGDVEGWRQQTTGPFSIHLSPGGHFFLRDCQPQLLRIIARQLDCGYHDTD